MQGHNSARRVTRSLRAREIGAVGELVVVGPRRVRIGSYSVRQHLEKRFAKHGKPRYIRADNGWEFIGEEPTLWLKTQDVAPIFIAKASPTQNCLGEDVVRRLAHQLDELRLVREVEQLRADVRLGSGRPTGRFRGRTRRTGTPAAGPLRSPWS